LPGRYASPAIIKSTSASYKTHNEQACPVSASGHAEKKLAFGKLMDKLTLIPEYFAQVLSGGQKRPGMRTGMIATLSAGPGQHDKSTEEIAPCRRDGCR
jgi:hypothetical protein